MKLAAQLLEVEHNRTSEEAHIELGCDGILDKPIIVVEGFDAVIDFSAADLFPRYPTMFEALNPFGL